MEIEIHIKMQIKLTCRILINCLGIYMQSSSEDVVTAVYICIY